METLQDGTLAVGGSAKFDSKMLMSLVPEASKLTFEEVKAPENLEYQSACCLLDQNIYFLTELGHTSSLRCDSNYRILKLPLELASRRKLSSNQCFFGSQVSAVHGSLP